MLLYDSGSVDETSPPTWYTFEASGSYPFICVFYETQRVRATLVARFVTHGDDYPVASLNEAFVPEELQ